MLASAWVEALLRSGEAMALLSLTGNHAATLKDEAAGSVVRHTARGQRSEPLAIFVPAIFVPRFFCTRPPTLNIDEVLGVIRTVYCMAAGAQPETV